MGHPAKLRLMADQTSSSAFRSFVETYYHAEIHPLVGGAWDCKFGEAKTLIDQFPSLAPYVEDILTDLGVLMRYAYSVQKNFSNGVLIPGMAGWSKQWGDVRCPQDCSSPHSGSQPNVTSAIDIDDNAPTSLDHPTQSHLHAKPSEPEFGPWRAPRARLSATAPPATPAGRVREVRGVRHGGAPGV